MTVTDPGTVVPWVRALLDECEAGWWVERKDADPVKLDRLCPGDVATVTADHDTVQRVSPRDVESCDQPHTA